MSLLYVYGDVIIAHFLFSILC